MKIIDNITTRDERIIYTKGPQLIQILQNPYIKVLLTLGVLVWLKYANEESWGVCLFVLGSVLLHEKGHSWAAKCSGLKVSGIWFVPFLGAVTLIEDKPECIPTNHNRWVIYFMGPLWGSAPAILLYWCLEHWHPEIRSWTYGLTREDHLNLYGFGDDLAVAIQWTALLNFANLLPIPFLDGGRMLWEVVLSLEKKWAFLLTGTVSLCIALYLLLAVKSILLTAVSALIIQDFWKRWRQKNDEARMNSPNILLSLLLHGLLLLATLYVAKYIENPIPMRYTYR